MKDKELLELAAKAAGFEVTWCDNVGPLKLAGFWIDASLATSADTNPRFLPRLWNPLTDDGDALRLAVKLQIDVLNDSVDHCEVPIPPLESVIEPYAEDDYAATRRTIVRAAAEIGKGMQ